MCMCVFLAGVSVGCVGGLVFFFLKCWWAYWKCVRQGRNAGRGCKVCVFVWRRKRCMETVLSLPHILDVYICVVRGRASTPKAFSLFFYPSPPSPPSPSTTATLSLSQFQSPQEFPTVSLVIKLTAGWALCPDRSTFSEYKELYVVNTLNFATLK